MRIEYHRTLIADLARNEAFLAALKSVIKPGETIVADIGAGTGLLGIMAARLGAKRVYMYESEAVAEVAGRVVKANKLRNIEIMPCHSTEMQDPPRADVVVSETLGNYALEENIIPTLHDAQRRHLAPGGTMIPSSIIQYACPVVSGRIARELDAWDRVTPQLGLDIDLSPAKELSLNNIYVRWLEPAELLDTGRAAREWDRVELGRETKSSRSGELRWKLDALTTINGFAVWWDAPLVPGIVMSTSPLAARTHWEQLYLPLPEPLAAQPGETVVLNVRSRSSYDQGTHLAWTATLEDRAGKRRARHAMDLDKGWLP